MGSRIVWRLAVTAVALTLTAGCGDKASPEASGAAASTPTASPAPSTTGSPTSSTPAIDPNIPADARAHTPAGAEAFAKHYVAELNRAFSRSDPSRLDELSGPSCTQCARYRASVADLAERHQHFGGDLITVKDSASSTKINGKQSVDLRMTQEPVALMDATGRVVGHANRKPASVTIVMDWVSGHWQVYQFRYSA